MPRNPTTGVFTRVSNSFSDPVLGTIIDPTDADALFDDYDAGLNDTVFVAQDANTVYAGPTAGADAVPTFRALVPADIPIAGLSADVAATGIQGIQNDPFIVLNSLDTEAPSYVAGFRSQFNVSYTTLNPNTSYAALWGHANVDAGVQDSYYGLLGNVYNHSDSGENCGAYLQGFKYADGQTWAVVTEARDLSGVADPTRVLCAIEADIFANGTDANEQRIGIEIVVGKNDSGGASCTATYGFRAVAYNNDLAQGSFTKAFSIEANVVDGIDMHTITASHSAMWLGDGQNILFDTAGTRGLRYTSTTLVYSVASTDVFSLTDGGSIIAAGRITGNGGLAVAGASSGTTNINAEAAASGTLTLPAATDTLVGRNTTDALTNKTLFPGVGTFSSGNAQIYRTATNGLVITGHPGASTDLGFYNSAGGELFLNPTGTTNTQWAGAPSFRYLTAPPAGGATTDGIKVSSTANFGIFWGSGSPAGVLSAAQGSIYLRTDGTASNRLYVNSSSGSGTTWQNY